MVWTLSAALVALIPAAVQLWRGRSLAPFVDDPAFPERLMATRRYSAIPIAVCLPLLIELSPHDLFWTVPLLVVSGIAAGYPLRKAIYRETWSVWTYLTTSIRFSAAVYGFWLAMCALPFLSDLTHANPWVTASIGAGVLVAWSRWYSDVVRFAAGTLPIEDPQLQSRFARVSDAMGVPRPCFEQIPLRGGLIANAIALPSLRQSTVLFTDAVLQFDRDEVVAICAHELAHLEYYNRRRLERTNAVTLALIISGAFVSPVFGALAPPLAPISGMLWIFALVGTILMRARDRQKNETASDLRAVAVTGDPEALVRALTRIHAVARLPRRWDPEVERRMTHPSLARRIQDIRAAAGTAPAEVDSVQVVSPDGQASATLHADRLELSEDKSAIHTLPYRSLADLRVEAPRSAPTRLVAVDNAGRRWQIGLAPADIARTQAALDRIDMQLARPAGQPRQFAVVSRLLAVATALIAMTGIQLAVVAAALLAIVQPAAPLLAASGVASIVGAILTWRDGSIGLQDPRWLIAAAMFGCGGLMLVLAYKQRAEVVAPPARRLVAALGVLAMLACIPAIVHAAGSVRLHQSASDRPSIATLAAGLGAALWLLRSRVSRCAAAAAGILALTFVVAGSGAFLEAFGRDPFLAPVEPLAVRPIARSAMSVFTVPFAASGVELSPGGYAVALSAEDDDDNTTYHVGPAGSELTSVSADDAAFLDDARLVILKWSDVPMVEEIRIDSPSIVRWKHGVPRLSSARLTVDRGSKQWRLLGITGAYGVVAIEGTVGSDKVTERHWPLPAHGRERFWPLAARGEQATVIERQYDTRLFELTGWWRLTSLIEPLRSEWRIWLIRSDNAPETIATSQLDLDCDAILPGGRPVCASFDGRRTRFFSIDAAERRLIPMGSATGNFRLYGRPTSGWIAGHVGRDRVVVHPEAREAVRMPSTSAYVRTVEAASHVVCTVEWSGHSSTVRIYRLE